MRVADETKTSSEQYVTWSIIHLHYITPINLFQNIKKGCKKYLKNIKSLKHFTKNYWLYKNDQTGVKLNEKEKKWSYYFLSQLSGHLT